VSDQLFSSETQNITVNLETEILTLGATTVYYDGLVSRNMGSHEVHTAAAMAPQQTKVPEENCHGVVTSCCRVCYSIADLCTDIG